MITFEIDPEAGNYKVGWTYDEPYEKLCLRIRQITPIKKIKEEKLELISRDDSLCNIYRSSITRLMPLPRLENATYSFELYDDESVKKCIKEYIGIHEPLTFTFTPYNRGFIKLSAACRCDISADWFWLSFKCPNMSSCFHFKPMKKEKGEFVTSCLLKEEAIDQLIVSLDEKIADYISVVKDF